MNVLVLGSGGREHALAWRLAKDPSVKQVFLHPGNPGTQDLGIPTLGDVSLLKPEHISAAAAKQGISLIVIGPEILLAQGVGDFLRTDGFLVVGPGAQGAQLETSKAFAKQFMQAAGIPTAGYQRVQSPEELLKAVGENLPIVLKFDGLAAGKGVVVATSMTDVEEFCHRVWQKQEFGKGPHTVVVEEFLSGKELSYIGLCDGESFVPLSSASDYKRLEDGDKGPNTGGMGAVSPSPICNPELEKKIQQQVVTPTLKQMQKRSLDYRGALYFGLMINAAGDPYVLEFNTRFGDPETQALLLRLQGDFGLLLSATAKRELSQLPPLRWSNDCSLYVVAAAAGYPSSPRTGDPIRGLDTLDTNTQVFFSGVQKTTCLQTGGGRVLGIGALGKDFPSCRSKVYSALKSVHWDGMQYRADIGSFA